MKKTIAILALLTSFTNSVFADKPDAGDLAPDFIISQLDGINFKLVITRAKRVFIWFSGILGVDIV